MRGWLAVEAVRSEPFSTTNSLLTGKIAGNFDDPGPLRSRFDRNNHHFASHSDEFIDFGTGNFVAGTGNLWPRNREFFGREQGTGLVTIQQRRNGCLTLQPAPFFEGRKINTRRRMPTAGVVAGAKLESDFLVTVRDLQRRVTAGITQRQTRGCIG
jgi:hypothetical protein